MARIREPQQPARGIEHSVEAGDEHLLGHVGTQVVIHPLQHRAGLDQALSRGPEHAAGGGHHQGGRHTLVGDVADDESDPPVRQGDDVIEVASHLPRGLVISGHLPTRKLGKLLGQEVLLDQPGDLELLLEALPGHGLSLLLADELADPQRRRRLSGEIVEQLAVVGGVLLLGHPRPQVQDPDQLALADERHDQLHAGRSQLGKGRRVELQGVDLDRPAGALEVGEERIVGADLHRRLRRRDLDAPRPRRLLLGGRGLVATAAPQPSPQPSVQSCHPNSFVGGGRASHQDVTLFSAGCHLGFSSTAGASGIRYEARTP